MAKKSPGRRKRMPMRSCIACRQSLPKRALVRIVASPDGVVIDPSGKLAGRGAYLCHDPVCWEKAIASKDLISRALRTTFSGETRAAMSAYMEQGLKEELERAAEGC